MCTLILATRVFDDSATFLAANRDEKLDRPAVGPFRWTTDPVIVAPRDEQHGGTWLGVNEYGVLSAITNRFGTPRDPDKRSRGLLVPFALAERTAQSAFEAVGRSDLLDFNPFHLVFADRESAHVVWSDGSTTHRDDLEPGVHVLTERSFGAAENGRAESLRAHIARLRADDALTRDAFAELLSVRRPGDIDCTCVLIDELDYGTRSSTLLDVDRRTLRFADGPPCEVDYDDHSSLLHELLP